MTLGQEKRVTMIKNDVTNLLEFCLTLLIALYEAKTEKKHDSVTAPF